MEQLQSLALDPSSDQIHDLNNAPSGALFLCVLCHQPQGASMTLKEFFQELETHDWYYAWSDDSRVYIQQRGIS